MDRKKLIGSATRYIAGRHALQTTYWRKPMTGGKGMVKTTRMTFFGKNEGPNKVDSAEMFAKIKKKAIQIIEEKEKDEEEDKPKTIKPKKPLAPKIKKLYTPKYLAMADGEDARNFDYVAERPPEHKVMLCKATLHLVSESLTACLMCINELYMSNGFVSSVVINVLLASMSTYCLYSLTKSAQKVYGITKVPMMTYPDLAQASTDLCSYPVLRKYGGKFRNTVIAVIIVRLVAKCCVYQIIMARGVHHQIYRVSDTSPENTRKYLGLVILPCILISTLRKIEYTAPFSFVSNAFIVILFFYTIFFGLLNSPLQFKKYKYINDAATFFSFCGGCVFTMDTSCAVLSVENTMNRPRKIYLVIIIGMLIVTLMTMFVGVAGSFGWALNSKAPVTLNFKVRTNSKDFVSLNFKMRIIPYTDFFQIGLLLSAYLSFGQDFWVLFNFLWAKLKFLHPPERHRIFEPLHRIGFALAITALGMLFPDLSGVMSLFGALASGLLNFMFPPIIEFLISTRRKRLGKLKWKVLRLAAITTFGWIFILCGTFCGLRDIFVKVYFT